MPDGADAIESIRVIHDAETGLSKGFGYLLLQVTTHEHDIGFPIW